MKFSSLPRATRRTLLALLLAAPVAALAQTPARAPLSPVVKVKVGTFKSFVDAPPAIANTRGYFKEEGLEVELVPFANSGEAMQALALGQIDALPGPVNAGMFNMLARKIPIKIVATAGAQPRGSGTIALVLRDDLVKSGRYKTPADLKGMKISIPGKTSAAHFYVKELAAKGNLALTDLDIVHLGLPEGLPAMVNKSIDGVATIEPYVSKTVAEAPGVRVNGMDDTNPGFPVSFLMYSPDFPKNNMEAARRFMIAFLRAGRDYGQAFGPQKRGLDQVMQALQANGINATSASVPPAIDPDGKISFAGVDDFANWLIKEGALKEKINLQSFVDDQFRDYAVKALAAK